MGDIAGIAAGRLSVDELSKNFDDMYPALDSKTAGIEASRCYFCYDAPCMEACPTGIDIPNFIRKIQTGNYRGSALDILTENIMGGACARVCPTEILCEEACVRTAQEDRPVTIGRLQRFSTDWLMETGEQPFERAAPTGKTVAVVGAGPAGLAAAHRLSMLGHEVEVCEARQKAGGLNEYGIAAYKVPHDFAQQEVDFILGLGGITVHYGQALGQEVTLAGLRDRYDAVFLGLGLGAVRALGLADEQVEGVYNAVDYIAALRQSDTKADIPVGRKVVVIGGGNTAVDIAVQTKRLGAEDVTLVYRRGADAMSATPHEQHYAQTNGVKIKHWAKPASLQVAGGVVTGVGFEYTELDPDGRLIGTGETFTLEANMVFKAIGQVFIPDPVTESAACLELAEGRIAVGDGGATSIPGVFAGGDCVSGGEDLTVAAVQDGKLAAHAINDYLANR
ncbi:NAD(P)-dependent oxidoreductase [Sneathiella chinensis]|uniref:dihydrouracil dehydrogenase (NAD(+)) n=1 Tax=Sneathiella chinensis TaxID=349750 RepID=A0ABQ5U498_9PROT|nr:NAD(P)-dependent oxidoreductase [Sneathiella chinensis]GLQ06992.1 dihydropyrimidine dehydrogenase subunit A [Sneathiella chinensis]